MFYRTFTLALLVQDNILITATSIKYIDFGLAIEIAPGSQIEDGKRAGSIGYMSPEMEAKLPYSLTPTCGAWASLSFRSATHAAILCMYGFAHLPPPVGRCTPTRP